jgi:hypothetical protein
MNKALCSVIFLVIISCTPKIVINNGYKHTKIKDASLSIILVGALNVHYAGDVKNEFGEGNMNELIEKFLFQRLPVSVKDSSTFGAVEMSKKLDGDKDVEQIEHIYKKKKIFIKLPSNKVNMTNSDYTLFLDSLSVFSEPVVSIVTYGFIPVIVAPHKPLILSSKFSLWDNKSNKEVAWGFATGTEDNGPAVKIEQWNLVPGVFAANLFHKTPFHKIVYDESFQ